MYTLEITQIQASDAAISKYNLTKTLNGTINGIFHIDYDIETNKMIEGLIGSSNSSYCEYQVKNAQKLKPFEDKIFFRNIKIRLNSNVKPELKHTDFIYNKTVIINIKMK